MLNKIQFLGSSFNHFSVPIPTVKNSKLPSTKQTQHANSSISKISFIDAGSLQVKWILCLD